MSLASDAEVSGHTHQPLPLRSVLKQSSVGASAPATPITSPTNSPYITRVALPSVSASPAPAISSLVSASTLAVTLTGNAPQQYTSPPPLTPGYTPKVSFDTFENPAASMFSFTLSVKTDGYKRTRSTRVFLCASSPDESGREALDWALESLVQDGDELIVYRGVDEDLLGKVDHDTMRDEARDLMRTIQAKSAEVDSDRKVCLIIMSSHDGANTPCTQVIVDLGVYSRQDY
ncbi:hypothetical protein AX16_007145 [Volvariella volvacea WC 439]|nr:hypothetical protein AX16_007145 [Volvariella volvacea WC 439]